jgi:hypothetical protein
MKLGVASKFRTLHVSFLDDRDQSHRPICHTTLFCVLVAAVPFQLKTAAARR